MKKITWILAVAVLAGVLMVSQASAFSLGGYSGLIEIKYDNWDYGKLYDPNTHFDKGNPAVLTETDSYGIVNVTQILAWNPISHLYNVSLWVPTGSEAIKGIFYGMEDNKVDINSTGGGTINDIGGRIELFLGANNLNPSAGPGLVPAANTAPTDIWNATDGTSFLTADFMPVIKGDGVTTYAQTLTVMNPADGTVNGVGSGYLNVTGGAYKTLFDTNSQLGGTDLFLTADYTGPGDSSWTVNSHDPVLGAVPEPATLLLLGMGLIGLGLGRRYRRD
jgi:hypothetical protein